MDVWTGYSYDSIPHLLEKYGPRSVDLVFMDQKGTRFHSDLALMEELGGTGAHSASAKEPSRSFQPRKALIQKVGSPHII